jgi:hypothetical protein
MTIPQALEPWSWVAGIVGAAIALVTLVWQVRIATKRGSRKGDWEVMDRAFHGVRVGAPIHTLQMLGLKPIDRGGSGSIKITKWQLDNGNEMSVTYDSVQDRILYMEVDWSQKTSGMSLGMGGLLFGRSTLKQIRRLYESNGFSYVKHVMFEIDDGIVTFNAFELRRTPTIIVIFITKLSDQTQHHISTLPPEKQVLGEIGEHFKLDAVAVADESYLDDIWGNEKIYDPKSTPIEL